MTDRKPIDPNDAKCMEDNNIQMFLHCRKCLEDFKNDAPGTEGESPSSYARYEVGWTIFGIQIWCTRHECNVMHMDFEGVKHPAV
jgi:hypothetical protein